MESPNPDRGETFKAVRAISRFFDETVGWNRVGFLLSITIIALAGVALFRHLRDIEVREVIDALRDIERTGENGVCFQSLYDPYPGLHRGMFIYQKTLLIVLSMEIIACWLIPRIPSVHWVQSASNVWHHFCHSLALEMGMLTSRVASSAARDRDLRNNRVRWYK